MRTRFQISTLVFIAVITVIGTVRVQASGIDMQAKVKAAYVLNFARFSTWPESAFDDTENTKSPLVIAVLDNGASDIVDLLTKIVEDEIVHGRTVTVRHFQYPKFNDPKHQQTELDLLYDQLKEIHLLYIDSVLQDHMSEIINHVHTDGLLTVSDCKQFADAGGMLGFIQRERRIVFEANMGKIDESNVAMSSQILRLAIIINAEEN